MQNILEDPFLRKVLVILLRRIEPSTAKLIEFYFDYFDRL